MRLKFFEVDQRWEIFGVRLVTILAREIWLKFFQLFNYISCQTANNVTSRGRKISLKFVEKISILNRIYRANIVTCGPRITSKACVVEKLSIAFIAPTSWLAALAPQSQRVACFNRISLTNIVTKASLLAIACKARLSLHCDVTQGKRSSTSSGWVHLQSPE